jgi:PBP1b-binding outer membrane lipoprotein LpoB
MRPTHWAAVATLAAAVLVGCQNKQQQAGPPVAPPATPQTVRDIRQSYQKAAPSTVVGLVIATMPESNLAAIGDVPVSQFKPGEVVTFIDSNQAVIAIGTVVNTTTDAVHVKYQPQGEAARPPRQGDLAVKTQS